MLVKNSVKSEHRPITTWQAFSKILTTDTPKRACQGLSLVNDMTYIYPLCNWRILNAIKNHGSDLVNTSVIFPYNLSFIFMVITEQQKRPLIYGY